MERQPVLSQAQRLSMVCRAPLELATVDACMSVDVPRRVGGRVAAASVRDSVWWGLDQNSYK